LRGDHGLEIQTAARSLVRRRLAYVIASDGHAGTRGQTLRAGFDLALAAGASPTQARQLAQANPGFLLRDGLPASPGAPAVRETAWQPRRGQLVRAVRDAARQLARSERG
jgi:protein-tyrosine phosphatase